VDLRIPEYLSEHLIGVFRFSWDLSFIFLIEISCQTFHFFCLHGMVFMQTFDAVDGKQARRTNSSSPLGELFDHGNLQLEFKPVYSVLRNLV